MTREDAILHMILRREELKNSVGDLDEDIKAFDMAIEALEQKPCDTGGKGMIAEEKQKAINALRISAPVMAVTQEEFNDYIQTLNQVMDLLEQEPSRDIEEIKEVMNCDADAETKCKMISNILTANSHYFDEPQESEDAE